MLEKIEFPKQSAHMQYYITQKKKNICFQIFTKLTKKYNVIIYI